MNGHGVNFYIEGTAALQMEGRSASHGKASILPFPQDMRESRKGGADALEAIIAGINRRALDILERSEMYCSLKLEDFRGCPYHLFTKHGIAMLSAATTAVAVASIALGY